MPSAQMSRKALIGGAAAATAGIVAYALGGFSGKKRSAQVSQQKRANLPEHVQYLLLGGGAASFGAFRAIKNADPKAQILVVSQERQQPYMKPPLSKELWQGEPCGVARVRRTELCPFFICFRMFLPSPTPVL